MVGVRRVLAVGALASLASLLVMGAGSVGPSPSGASLAAAAPVSALIDACGAGSYEMEPTSVVLACADAGIIASKLVWTHWTSARAVATGVATVEDCTPSCVAGHTYAYPAELTLSKTRLLDGRLLFTTAALRFTGRLPIGWRAGRTSTFPIPIAPRTTDAETLVTEAWTTFFSGAASVGERSDLLEHGTADTTEIRSVFSRLPWNLSTEVDSVAVGDRVATVTYRFVAGAHPVSGVETGTAVDVGGKWLVSSATWSKLVTGYHVHVSG